MAAELATSPNNIFQKLVETAVALCGAQTAGISLLEGDGKHFHWPAITGRWASQVGGGTPREYGPCGTVLDRNRPQLMSHVERYFTDFVPVKPWVEEALLIPFYLDGKASGTIWIVVHDESRRFDGEDLRVMTNLGTFAAAAYQLLQSIKATSEANRQLKQTEGRYRRLFEAAKDGVLIVDPCTRRIIDANPYMTELLGYTREELVDKELCEVGLFENRGACDATFQALSEQGFLQEENLPGQTRVGKHLDLEMLSNVYEEAGRKVIQCNIRDITKRKQAERALRRSEENLERKVNERTATLRETVGELEAFSYSIAHDMRAPLRAMQGYAKIVCENYSGQIDATGQNYLERIVNSADRLDHLIQDVLNYSKIVRGCLEFFSLDVEKLLHDVVDSYPDLQAPKVEIMVKGPLPPVQANVALMTQVLSNLLENAVKFVDPGVKPRVCVRGEADDRWVTLWIEDNGIGIDKDSQERIFQMFQRLNRAELYEGTGMGLAIVRKAVQRMGGTAGVESEPGKGSRFWVKLKRGGLHD